MAEDKKEEKKCNDCGWFIRANITDGYCAKHSNLFLKEYTPACNAFEEPKYR